MVTSFIILVSYIPPCEGIWHIGVNINLCTSNHFLWISIPPLSTHTHTHIHTHKTIPAAHIAGKGLEWPTTEAPTALNGHNDGTYVT